MLRTLTSGQMSQAVCVNHLNTAGTGFPSGAIMKAKYFRLNIVFTAPVTVFWALVYVPEGMPIGTLNVTTATPGQGQAPALYEPQQFLLASGLYANTTASVGGGSAGAPLKVWTPLARNLNPGDGIFFIWRASPEAANGQALMTISYATCVN